MPQHVKVSLLGPPALRMGQRSPEAFIDTVLEHWRAQLDRVLPDRPDLIVIPEACDTCELLKDLAGLESLCAARGDRVLDLLAGISRRHRCYITYPAYRRLANGTFRNSVQLLGRGGEVVGIYDKAHPTISEIEIGVVPGSGATIIETDFGRVGVAICFDLNFDSLRQQYASMRPDLIIFCSLFHGGLMQPYWAYSTRAHFVGAVSNLPCQAYAPHGRLHASSTGYTPRITTTLNLDCRLVHLDYHNEKIEELKKRYGPQVNIDDPGLLGSVLISSECPDTTAQAMIEQAGIELLDDYLARSLAIQARFRQSASLEPAAT